MSRYRPEDIARLGDGAQKQIRLAQLAAQLQADQAKCRSKYGNTPTELDRRKFDSKVEAVRYAELRLLQRSGRITELICQPEYPITVNGITVARYIADFEYMNQYSERVVEDVKSEATRTNPVFRLKKKLVEAIHGISITEVVR
jgi:hypothetical protein